MLALFVVGWQIAKFGTEVVTYEMASRLLTLYPATTKQKHSQQTLKIGYCENTASDRMI
jgi:hypothetical protein